MICWMRLTIPSASPTRSASDRFSDPVNDDRLRIVEAVGVFQGHDVEPEIAQATPNGPGQSVHAAPVQDFDLDVFVALPHGLGFINLWLRAVEVDERTRDGDDGGQQIAYQRVGLQKNRRKCLYVRFTLGIGDGQVLRVLQNATA